MKLMISLKSKSTITVFCAAIFGAIAFFIIYPYLLDFSYDAWLLTAGPDQIQYYTAWLMYRQAEWSWPLGMISNYAYPAGISISYTDSIPLLAIFFKIFASYLPTVWQYTGLWILICFVLQGIFSYLLLEIFFKNKVLSLIGSIFFILSPIMLFRMGGHFALAGHWLILAALWVLFYDDKLHWKTWFALAGLAMLIHPYLLFTVVFITIFKILDLLLVKKVISLKKFSIFILLFSFYLIFLAYILGLFVVQQATAPGYGDFSMNLNALFNPMDWSGILANRPVVFHQAEGFAYLGLGMILLLVFGLIKLVQEKNKLKQLKNNWPLLLFCFILILLAVSHIVTWDDHVLFKINWPNYIIDNFFGIFRSSGRLFWPVYYLIMLGAVLSVRKLKFHKALIILFLALFIQIYDLSNKIIERNKEYQDKVYEAPINEQISQFLPKYKHLSFLPVINHKYFPYFVLEATKNNLTINDGYFAREPVKMMENRNQEIEQVKNGVLDRDTVYIISRDSDSFLANINKLENLIINFDNNIIIFPYYK
jgi:hypothetical protein